MSLIFIYNFARETEIESTETGRGITSEKMNGGYNIKTGHELVNLHVKEQTE
jgi:hypothetical protein